MAVVSKKEIGLPNGKRFMRVVKYGKEKSYRNSDPKGEFWVDLPEEVLKWNDNKVAKADTETEAITLFNDLIKTYFDATKKQEKVIVIKFEIQAYIPKKKGTEWRGNNENDFLVHRGYRFRSGSEDLKLSFIWAVFNKINVGGKINFLLVKGSNFLNYNFTGEERYATDDDATIKIIGWTEEREQWVQGVQDSFEGMIIKIDKFLKDNTNKKLEQLIDTGSKLLLTN